MQIPSDAREQLAKLHETFVTMTRREEATWHAVIFDEWKWIHALARFALRIEELLCIPEHARHGRLWPGITYEDVLANLEKALARARHAGEDAAIEAALWACEGDHTPAIQRTAILHKLGREHDKELCMPCGADYNAALRRLGREETDDD